MVICTEQWHARRGLFIATYTIEKFTAYDDLNIVNYKVFVLIIMLLLTNGDTERNPGPKRRTPN